MNHPKKLAVSFVLTIAALPGCESTPPVAVAPTGDVPNPPMPMVSSDALPTAAAVPSATATAVPPSNPPPPEQAPTLPPAPTGSGWQITANPNGTCTAYAIVHCPVSKSGVPMMCNPPPPHAVQCPRDAGP